MDAGGSCKNVAGPEAAGTAGRARVLLRTAETGPPGFRMRRMSLSVLLVALCTVCGHAQAQDKAALCMQGSDVDARIQACTDLLQGSTRLSNAKKAMYFGYRGWALSQKGEPKAALADLDTSIALRSDDFGAFGTRAGIHKVLGDFDKALADIDRCIRLAPRMAAARTVRGDILREKGDLEAALADYATALKMDPTEVAAFKGRSLVFRSRGRLKEAEAELLRAMALDNRLAELFTAQGQLAESNGDLAKAREAYAKALTLPRSVRFTDKTGSPIFDATRSQATARARLAVLDAAQREPEAQPPGAAPKKLALVIGNGAYAAAASLPNPVNDARLIARNLRAIGFETTEGIDLKRDGMRKDVNDFLRKAPAATIALIYYAGHGVQIDGKNYLVPVDSRLDGGRDALGDLIDLDFIMAGLDDKLRANVIVLDACRDNPFAAKAAEQADASRSLGVRSGLAPQSGLATGGTLGAGTLLAFATAPGQVALDGEGDNSPFSGALGRHITTPGLELQQMLTRVRSEVVASTKGKQVPWSNSSLLGEVYLTTK